MEEIKDNSLMNGEGVARRTSEEIKAREQEKYRAMSTDMKIAYSQVIRLFQTMDPFLEHLKTTKPDSKWVLPFENQQKKLFILTRIATDIGLSETNKEFQKLNTETCNLFAEYYDELDKERETQVPNLEGAP